MNNKFLFVGIVATFVIVALAVNAEPSLIILIIIFSSALSTLLFLPQRLVQNEVKTFISLIVDGILLTVVLACYIGLQEANGLIASILIGFGIMATVYLIQRHIFKPLRMGQKKTTFSSISQWVINPNDRDIRSAILRWKDDGIDDEFVFRGLGLPSQIPESRFAEFIRIARRRQTNALYGTKWSMTQVGNCQFRQLKKNEVLSAIYYTRRRYPKWPVDEYWACMMVLGYTRLLQKKGQGDSGRLIGDKGAGWYIEEAKRRWLLLLEQIKPQPLLSRILRRN